MIKKTKSAVIVIGFIIGVLILGAIGWYKSHRVVVPVVSTQASATTFTLSELAKFDGTDPSKPIYIGLNGLVYDVTTGKSFYEKGGSYNWLAGKDSSKDLNLIGGDIIKRKYPVIGKLVQ